MSKPVPLSVSVARVIEAPPNELYDLVADVTRMPTFSPETIAVEWLDGATNPAVGVRFKGTNRIKRAKWSTKPTITAAERGHRFAFKVPGASGPDWVYTFEPVAGGTKVTESMMQAKPSPAILRFIQRRNGVTDRAEHLRAGMAATLELVAEAARAQNRHTIWP